MKSGAATPVLGTDCSHRTSFPPAGFQAEAQPTGEIGPGVGFVPGDGGEGTSMSGECVGMPGGGSVGCPGCGGGTG